MVSVRGLRRESEEAEARQPFQDVLGLQGPGLFFFLIPIDNNAVSLIRDMDSG